MTDPATITGGPSDERPKAAARAVRAHIAAVAVNTAEPGIRADQTDRIATWLWTSAPGMAAWQREEIADAVRREFGASA